MDRNGRTDKNISLSFRKYIYLRATSVPQPGHSPHPPEGRRIAERVAMDQEEIGGAAFDDATGRCFALQGSAAGRRGREGLPPLEARVDQSPHLPHAVGGPPACARH